MKTPYTCSYSSKVHAEVLQGHEQGEVNTASQLAGLKRFSEQLSAMCLSHLKSSYIKRSKQTFKRLDLHLPLKSQQGAPAKRLSRTYKESCYYHRNLLPTAWKCDLFCSNVVEICWDWKIDYSFLKRAQCFVASESRFYLGRFRFCLCRAGANNASALIPPSYLNSQIMWTFVI